MLSIPILARLLGSNGSPKRETQEKFVQSVREAAFRLDPAMRYYLLSDFHLDPQAPEEHAGLVRLLGRLLTEGGIGGVFLLGDLAARPGLVFEDLEKAHPKLFDTLYRLTMLTPVFWVQGECDLGMEIPDHFRVVDRFEDDRWLFLHGHQFDPSVQIQREPETDLVLHVERGQPDVEATLRGLRQLKEESGKHVVFGHLHRAGYVEPNLTCLGHWTGQAADYAILRQGQIFLSRART